MIQLENISSDSLVEIPLSLTIDTALCVGAGGSTGSLADKPIIRNAQGQLLIPGSQLKGRLRHECEKLARGLGWPVCQSPKAETMCPRHPNQSEFHISQYRLNNLPVGQEYHCIICQIFGNPVLPSRIIFDDLICPESPENLPSEVLRPGVTINRRRQTAEDQKLYFLETSPAAKLTFSGTLELLRNSPEFAKPLLLAGLHHIHALGGSKSTGLGWLTWSNLDSKFSFDDSLWSSLIPQ